MFLPLASSTPCVLAKPRRLPSLGTTAASFRSGPLAAEAKARLGFDLVTRPIPDVQADASDSRLQDAFFFFLVCDAKPRSRLLRQLTPRRSQVVLVGNQSHGIEPPALGCLSIGSGSRGREKRLSKRIPGLVKTKSY